MDPKAKPDRRKAWKYRGCSIRPQNSDRPQYFGSAGTTDGGCAQYRRRWWQITFPDRTWCMRGTKADCCDYIDRQYPARGVTNATTT